MIGPFMHWPNPLLPHVLFSVVIILSSSHVDLVLTRYISNAGLRRIMTTTDSLFQNLLTELLEIIFNNLRRLPGSFRSLAQTSRRFCNIVIPILYSSICLRNSNSG